LSTPENARKSRGFKPKHTVFMTKMSPSECNEINALIANNRFRRVTLPAAQIAASTRRVTEFAQSYPQAGRLKSG
jgi:hypothetical protein